MTWAAVEGEVGHGDEAEKLAEWLPECTSLQRGTFLSADSGGTERGGRPYPDLNPQQEVFSFNAMKNASGSLFFLFHFTSHDSRLQMEMRLCVFIFLRLHLFCVFICILMHWNVKKTTTNIWRLSFEPSLWKRHYFILYLVLAGYSVSVRVRWLGWAAVTTLNLLVLY